MLHGGRWASYPRKTWGLPRAKRYGRTKGTERFLDLCITASKFVRTFFFFGLFRISRSFIKE